MRGWGDSEDGFWEDLERPMGKLRGGPAGLGES